MLTELRRYAVVPGQMDAMHRRMQDMLLPMFAEHGIPRPRAIWEDRDGASVLSWLVDWPDFEARQAGWMRIAPHFATARQAEGTPEFVTRTTLTLISPWAGHSPGFTPEGRCETGWHVQPRIGFGLAFAALCEGGVFDRFRAVGAVAVNAANLVFGALPHAFVLLSWPDPETRNAGMAALREQPMPDALASALLGDGPCFGARGEWSDLDRASYLKD